MAANSISHRFSLILMLAAALVWPPAISAQNSDDEKPIDAEAVAPLHRLLSQLTITAPSRVRLLEELSWKIEDVDTACRLTEVQKEKLRLAGQGDVKRFLDRIDGVQARLQSAQTSGEYDEIGNECDALKRLLKSGLFEEGSYFAKIRQSILTADQLAKLDAELPVEKLRWTEDLDEAKASAATQNRPVLIYVHAKWCGPCRQVERMMQSAVVRRYLCRKFVLVSLDVDKNPDLAREFGIKSIPCQLVVTAKGELLARVEGLQEDESTFLNRLEFTGPENVGGRKTGILHLRVGNQATDR